MKKTRKNRIAGALAVTLLLAAGCAPQRQWSKPKINQNDFDADAAQCRREAARATAQDPFSADMNQGLERSTSQERRFEACMFARGYRLGGGEAGQ